MSDLKDILAGRFVVIDGPDGAGKSTQLRLLAEWLRGQGLAVTATRDPGGTAIGDRIRQILLDGAHGEMAAACETMLYMASRAQLAAEVIRPALARGDCVLCDRYVSATVAYQGAGGVPADDVMTAGRIAVGDTWPDLTVILDLPAEEGLARIAGVGAPDRVESKAPAFHRRVAELFREQAARDPARVVVIDARGSIDDVQARLRQAVTSRAAR